MPNPTTSVEVGLRLIGVILPAVHVIGQRALTDETLTEDVAKEDAVLLRLRLSVPDVGSVLTDPAFEQATRAFIQSYVAFQDALTPALASTEALRAHTPVSLS